MEGGDKRVLLFVRPSKRLLLSGCQKLGGSDEIAGFVTRISGKQLFLMYL